MPQTIHQISPDELPLMEGLMTVFGNAFADLDTYTGNRPTEKYTKKLLAKRYFIALVAIRNDEVVGGLTAYELLKFEQARSEIYIYDLAVAHSFRRQGIASALIEALREIALARKVGTIIVQADTEPEDEPAIALYTKLGRRHDVLHFDIIVNKPEAQ